MKKLIFLLLAFIITSCVKYIDKETIKIESKIIYKQHIDAKSEYTYHYGYSMWKGKFCYHYGNESFPEKNIVKYVFLKDTIEEDNLMLYNKDTLYITYVKVYAQTNNSTYFHHNKIIKIE